MKNALMIPYVFVMMNWAAVMGLVHYLRGSRDVWTASAAPTSTALPRSVPTSGRRTAEPGLSRAEAGFRSSLVSFHRRSS